jgi:hypothetical protein
VAASVRSVPPGAPNTQAASPPWESRRGTPWITPSAREQSGHTHAGRGLIVATEPGG